MQRFLSKVSLAAQFLLLTATCLVFTSSGALLVVDYFCAQRGRFTFSEAQTLRLELCAVLSLTALVGIGSIMAAVRTLLLAPLHRMREGMAQVIDGDFDTPLPIDMPSRDWQQIHNTFQTMVEQLRTARADHDRSQRVLAERTTTVDRLLEFSQTIQGAGTCDQVLNTLSQFLETELQLAGIVILSHQHEDLPPIAVRSVRPANLLRDDCPVVEMDAAMCPCLRQNLAKQFKPDASPVRCGIDKSLSLPENHAAYCIPFNVGRELRFVVHMVLPLQTAWTDNRRQLAQTYVNSAISSLISLHLLEEAEKQSMTDALTGLFNRRSMEQLLQREVALAERHSHPMTVVMVDMDHFKEINDTHGHAAGDHLLKAFSDCVRITLRKTDLAFRYGGDEFVIALPQTPLGQAEQVVQKLRQAFASVDFSHAIAHLDHQPTLSIGVTERKASSNVLTLEHLLFSADQALYQAKLANRNCVKIYTPPQAA